MKKMNFKKTVAVEKNAEVEISDPTKVTAQLRTAKPQVGWNEETAAAYAKNRTAKVKPAEFVIVYMATGPTTYVEVYDHREATVNALKTLMATGALTRDPVKMAPKRAEMISKIAANAKVVITKKGSGDEAKITINLYNPEDSKNPPTARFSHSRKRPTKADFKKCGMNCAVSLTRI